LKDFYRNTLWILFVLAVLLLGTNLFLESFSKKNDYEINYPVRIENIEGRFLSTLNNFGLKEEWIKKKKSSHSYSNYNVTLPADLTIPEVLLDLFNEFKNDTLIIESKEKIAGGRTTFTLKTENDFLLQAEFKYNKKFLRERGTIAFILKDIELDSVEDSVLVESAGKHSLLLIPAEENLDHLSYINENRKSFAVLISDGITDPVYKIDAKYSKLRLLNAIKALSVDYAKSSFFVIDDNSDFYASEKFSFFNEELSKRNIQLFKMTDFISLETADYLISDFNLKMKELRKDELKIFLVSKEEYLLLKPGISMFKKSGVKVINGSEI
jgi:hypothetical protein